MPKRILIMGLPGSGKTTLAAEMTANLFPNCLWLNADAIREEYNDWDFSHTGRIRQSQRMRDLADASDKEFVIADFVAPLAEMRTIFAADYTVWLNTISEGRFADTNKLFERPDISDPTCFVVYEQYAEKWAPLILREIIKTL